MSTSFSNSSGYGPAGCKKIVLQLWWQRFDSIYPTEEVCRNEVFSHLQASGQTKCNICESTDITFANNERDGQCNRCRNKVSVTAGTFFDNVRRFRPWWAAIFLMGQGVSFNPCDLQKLVNTVYSNAWKIHQKICIVIDSSLSNHPSAMAVDSALFADAFCRRSRETPANQHPFAEQAETEKHFSTENPKEANTGDKSTTSPSSTNGATGTAGTPPLSSSAQAVYDLLSLTPITIDQSSNLSNIPIAELSSILIMLELDGLIESLPGEKYVRSNAAASKPSGPPPGTGQNPGIAEDAVVTAILGYIRSGFHGISRKYLQAYLAAHWCHTDRGSWSPISLLKACGGFRSLKYEDILAYVTPLKVKLVPC